MVSLTLLRRQHALARAARQLEILEAGSGQQPFSQTLAERGLEPLAATGIEVLQINVGKICNQTCHHCHVDAGPDRREIMSLETVQQCLDVLARTDIPVLDITGGAPELNPHFRLLVQEARRLGRRVIDRCNLTILLAAGYQDLPEFLAEHQVEVVASLPCYLEENTDAQRGTGVFRKSIEALKRLNEVGYGCRTGLSDPQTSRMDTPVRPHGRQARGTDTPVRPNSLETGGTDDPVRRDGRLENNLVLTLVYNPGGPSLPPNQEQLEEAYRRELRARYGIEFTRLYTITNMPISRFLDDLLEHGMYEPYMQKLIDAFNPAAAPGVMCRTTLSVDWQGYLYDCDFNQMLELKVAPGLPQHIRNFDAAALQHRRIVTGQHCYGCTAGAGSSCMGKIAD